MFSNNRQGIPSDSQLPQISRGFIPYSSNPVIQARTLNLFMPTTISTSSFYPTPIQPDPIPSKSDDFYIPQLLTTTPTDHLPLPPKPWDAPSKVNNSRKRHNPDDRSFNSRNSVSLSTSNRGDAKDRSIDRLKGMLDEKDEEINNLKMSVSGLERLAKYGQNEIEELKDNFAKMKRELEKQREIANLNKQISEKLQGSEQKLQKVIDELKSSHQAAETRYRNEIDNLKKELISRGRTISQQAAQLDRYRISSNNVNVQTKCTCKGVQKAMNSVATFPEVSSTQFSLEEAEKLLGGNELVEGEDSELTAEEAELLLAKDL